jgi:hypothetical protein
MVLLCVLSRSFLLRSGGAFFVATIVGGPETQLVGAVGLNVTNGSLNEKVGFIFPLDTVIDLFLLFYCVDWGGLTYVCSERISTTWDWKTIIRRGKF